eukprot:14956-Amorphochlora_amoeboformis.AAC.1
MSVCTGTPRLGFPNHWIMYFSSGSLSLHAKSLETCWSVSTNANCKRVFGSTDNINTEGNQQTFDGMIGFERGQRSDTRVPRKAYSKRQKRCWEQESIVKETQTVLRARKHSQKRHKRCWEQEGIVKEAQTVLRAKT